MIMFMCLCSSSTNFYVLLGLHVVHYTGFASRQTCVIGVPSRWCNPTLRARLSHRSHVRENSHQGDLRTLWYRLKYGLSLQGIRDRVPVNLPISASSANQRVTHVMCRFWFFARVELNNCEGCWFCQNSLLCCPQMVVPFPLWEFLMTSVSLAFLYSSLCKRTKSHSVTCTCDDMSPLVYSRCPTR